MQYVRLKAMYWWRFINNKYLVQVLEELTEVD
jgi:hypothetical protein